VQSARGGDELGKKVGKIAISFGNFQGFYNFQKFAKG